MTGGIKKVLDGILLFRSTVRKDLVKQYEVIRDHPNPLAVFFTCMDSRILPTRVTQAQVGDMFVVRNSGNMIPRAQNFGTFGYEVSVTTEPAALELAVKRGGIRHVIVCGHSDCKAINTLYNLHQCPDQFDPCSPMDHWLRKNGHESMQKLLIVKQKNAANEEPEIEFCSDDSVISFKAVIDPDMAFGVEDRLSQINTLQQLINIESHGFLQDYLRRGYVHLHAFWFDVYTGQMHMFSRARRQFIVVDEQSSNDLLTEVKNRVKETTNLSPPPADGVFGN